MNIFEKIAETLRGGGRGVLVTVVDRAGSAPSALGSAMLVLPSGGSHGTIGGGALEAAAEETAREMMGGRGCLLRRYDFDTPRRGSQRIGERTVHLPMLCGGGVTLFYQPVGSEAEVVIFGAGHVGAAVTRVLSPMNLHVTVVDTRRSLLEALESEGVSVLPAVDYRETAGKLEYLRGAYCLIATHSHEEDFAVLKAIVESRRRPVYIGIIASRRKAAEFLDRLAAECSVPVPAGILHMPCGLDIGGPTPGEIAVSVAAEIQAVRYGRSGHRHMSPDLVEIGVGSGAAAPDLVEIGEGSGAAAPDLEEIGWNSSGKKGHDPEDTDD